MNDEPARPSPSEMTQQGSPSNMAGRPFMEHPSGRFETAAEAMADAVERLRALPAWDEWITFSAQGAGSRADSYEFAEIRLKSDRLQVIGPSELDTVGIATRAGVPERMFYRDDGEYVLSGASPQEVARVMDAIFRMTFGIAPHPGEDDYPVGAEW